MRRNVDLLYTEQARPLLAFLVYRREPLIWRRICLAPTLEQQCSNMLVRACRSTSASGTTVKVAPAAESSIGGPIVDPAKMWLCRSITAPELARGVGAGASQAGEQHLVSA